MPKVAQSYSTKLRSWIAPYNKESEVFTTDGKVVFCNICSKPVGCEKKSQIDAHALTAAHTGLVARKKNQNKEKQTLLTQSSQSSAPKNAFYADLCFALVASNIPLHKLNSDPFKNFLQKYMQQQIPSESNLRKVYVPLIHAQCIDRIRRIVGGNYLYICVDESTDARGYCIANLLIGTLRAESASETFLIACQRLERTNHETISRFINQNLRRFFESILFEDKILLLVSDAAPYMIKAGKGLRLFYKNLHHVTCIMHGLNRLAEKLRDLCPKVNELVSCGKKMFLKAPLRVDVYKQIMPNMPLPPVPVITRWGTWLSAALFYAENFQNFKDVVNRLEQNAESVRKAKLLIEDPHLQSELTFLLTHLSFLPKSMDDLIETKQSLQNQIESIDLVVSRIDEIPEEKGTLLQRKMTDVLAKNEGLTFLRKIKSVQSGEGIEDEEINRMDPSIIQNYKYAPLSSVEVERSFSLYKYILSDRRHNLHEDNMEMYMITSFNKV